MFLPKLYTLQTRMDGADIRFLDPQTPVHENAVRASRTVPVYSPAFACKKRNLAIANRSRSPSHNTASGCIYIRQ